MREYGAPFVQKLHFQRYFYTDEYIDRNICDHLQEKGSCAAKNKISVNTGFHKYDAIATSIENLTLIGRVVCEI